MHNLKNINAPKADVFLPYGLSNKPSVVGALFLNEMDSLIGHKFGRLTVIDFSHINNDRRKVFNCLCDCGNIKSVSIRSLNSGTKSCGCLIREATIKRCTTHGQAMYGNASSEYNAWQHIKDRCHNPKNKRYSDYGGRGIIVCERWRDSFDNFLADMGKKPFPKASIDRIDNNGNYEPGNCRWATKKEQANNSRRNHFIKYNGEVKTIAQWSEFYGIKYMILLKRLRAGWSFYDSINKPIRVKTIY